MELRDVISGRRSVRRFAATPVTKEQAQELVKAGRWAPSSLNSQPWYFTVVSGGMRNKVVEIVSRSTIYLADVLATYDPESRALAERFICDLGGAPCIIIVSVPTPEEEFRRLNTLLAVGGALQNLQLAACDMGLASCNITFAFWVRDELAELLSLVNREIVSIVVVGYPDEKPTETPRSEQDSVFLGFEDNA